VPYFAAAAGVVIQLFHNWRNYETLLTLSLPMTRRDSILNGSEFGPSGLIESASQK
jgi:hypothetical protein